MSDAEWQRIQLHQAKYHNDGHATAEEACACYRTYLLDNRLQLDGMSVATQHKCAVCGAWTQKSASVEFHHWNLCESHLNREEVEKLMPAVRESMGSY